MTSDGSTVPPVAPATLAGEASGTSSGVTDRLRRKVRTALSI